MSIKASWGKGRAGWRCGRTWLVGIVGGVLSALLACGPGMDEGRETRVESLAQPATSAVVPLFDANTPLEPAMVEERADAIVTRFSDRVRDRHAREGSFRSYEHYLPLYFDYRTISVELIDYVARGGNKITVNITSLWKLDKRDFRAFYRGEHEESAEYVININMEEVGPNKYTATVDYNPRKADRKLAIGDPMEIEISRFFDPIAPPDKGRPNYYGTVFLYVVGKGGLVPWEGKNFEFQGPDRKITYVRDSSPLKETAWLGGRTTLSYNYSNEPVHQFKQMSTNLAPMNAQPFVEGRRLHHTDFGDGTHSEADNPVFTEHRNQLGPRFVARSCVGCHINNGRALPPGESASTLNVRFFVNNAAWADLHYSINGGGQQSFRMEPDSANNNSHVVKDIPGGATVKYHFTIAEGSGLKVTPEAQFIAGGGGSGGTGGYGYSVLAPPLSYTLKVGQVNGTTVSPHPQLGHALQSQSISGDSPEGTVRISSWTTTGGTFSDGAAYQLRRPNYAFSGPVPTNYSARIAPPLVGMGLLEAIAESTIAGMEDPNDINSGDGITGRMQVVRDAQTGQPRMGRFGWKAGQASVSQQIANALNLDMGVLTTIYRAPDCGGAGCPSAGIELSDGELDKLVRYVSLLGVPARRNLDDAQAKQGEGLFTSMGCSKCHVPTLTTSPHHPKAELRGQTIRPYTDLLLHDMGEGLADNLPEAGASGAEWRTPPLWGIGLTASVSGGEAYLHDGRARSLSEAILWHGGEANTAKEKFRTATSAERNALLAFLRSL